MKKTMKSVKRLYKINKFFVHGSAVLAFFFFLFNLVGAWSPWHLAGFGWVLWQYPAAAFMVISMLRALFRKDEDYSFGQRLKYIFLNLWLLLVSVIINHLSITYFSPWGLYEYLYQAVESLMKMLG